jgi:thiamine biosynthesis lipoprotein
MIEGTEGQLGYQHRAMATVFEIMIVNEDPSFAEGAAHAAFEEIDRLEQELSRYAVNSDVARINNLPPHGSVRVGLDTFRCLRLSMQHWEETGGAFDVTMGALMECWIGKDRSLLHPSPGEIERAKERSGMKSLELDESAMTVRLRESVPFIDLGAIGKGYAVDRAVELLKEWGVSSALVHGGTSSVYAFGPLGHHRGWPVTLSDPRRPAEILEKVILADEGLGGSGIKKGRHIIDPRSARPVEGRRAAWVLSESAARSDALSTACMVMAGEEIERCVARDARLRAVVVEGEGGSVLRFGRAATV